MKKMTWTINQEECVGCGICTRFCMDITMEQGKAVLKNENSGCISQAADVCPRGIISEA